MRDETEHYDYDENVFPLAYLLTFRTYGTWLHGSDNYSVSDSKNTAYGSPKVSPSVPLKETMRSLQKGPAVVFDERQRAIVRKAIDEVCAFREYYLRALNIRTNHAHAVVSAQKDPDRIAGEFKAYATRSLRAERQFSKDAKIWTRGGSTRYLWKDRHVEAAIDYVKYCQEDIPFEFKERRPDR